MRVCMVVYMCLPVHLFVLCVFMYVYACMYVIAHAFMRVYVYKRMCGLAMHL